MYNIAMIRQGRMRSMNHHHCHHWRCPPRAACGLLEVGADGERERDVQISP